jgi:signal transduction histidine kinase/ActR/RegA family two-component response regulator/PAS domain-containing protein
MIRSETEALLELALNLSKQPQRTEYLSYFCEQCARSLNLEACIVVKTGANTAELLSILSSYPTTIDHSALNQSVVARQIPQCSAIGVIQPLGNKTHLLNAGCLGYVLLIGDVDFSLPFFDSFATLIKNISENQLQLRKSQQLIQENQRLNFATKAGSIGTWALNTVTQQLHWDDQMFRLFEIEKKTFDGTFNFFKKHFHPEDADTINAVIGNYLAPPEKGPIDTQLKIITPSGEIKKLGGHIDTKIFDDGNKYVVGVVYDITEIETARTQSIYRSQLETLLIELSMKVIRSGPDDLDTVTNQALQVVGSFVGADRAYRFSYDFNANVTHNTHEWCNEGITPEIDNLQNISNINIEAWTSSHLRGLPMYVARVLDLPKDNRLRTILEPQGVRSLITIPLMEANNCLGFIGFDSVKQERNWNDVDISVLKLLAELLTNAHIKAEHELTLRKTRQALTDSRDTARFLSKEASAASVAKSTFVANVSHEIRTPLHAILGIADLCLLETSSPILVDNLTTIKNAGKTLLNLINDVLDLSRAEANNVNIKNKPFNVGTLTNKLEKLFTPLAQNKNISFDIHIQPCVPEVLIGDELRIYQILSNLITNAVKFTKIGGVTLNIVMDNDPWLTEEDQKINIALIRFEVVDTGIGIAESDMGKLFDPFFQSEEAISNQLGGTGLGLPISHLLATKMGGVIHTQSVRHHGSTFSFEIALQSGQGHPLVKTEAKKTIEQSMQLNGFRILLAEDNPVNQQLIRTFLAKSGCQLDIVADGDQALSAYQDTDYDIILMDCQMPKLDGYDTSKIIRLQESKQQHIPILAVTSSAMEGDRELCLQAGMDDLLAKPFSKQELLSAITRLTTKESASR